MEFCSFCPGWRTMAWSWLTTTSASRVQVISASASEVTGITGMCHDVQLIFCVFSETRFHQVDQAGLKLPTSGDQPASVSQSVGITDVSHCDQPVLFSFYFLFNLYFSFGGTCKGVLFSTYSVLSATLLSTVVRFSSFVCVCLCVFFRISYIYIYIYIYGIISTVNKDSFTYFF